MDGWWSRGKRREKRNDFYVSNTRHKKVPILQVSFGKEAVTTNKFRDIKTPDRMWPAMNVSARWIRCSSP